MLDFLQKEKAETGFGEIVTNATSYEDVMQQTGLNWTVDARPIYTEIEGSKILIPNKKVIVRKEDNKAFGVVSDHYKIVNNEDAFAFTEALFNSQEIEFTRGGSYRGGSKTWLECRVTGQYSVLGDEVECFMIFMNSHDGMGSVRALILPKRTICSNALNLAMKKACRAWSCTHSGDPTRKMEEARKVLLKGSTYMTALEQEAEELNKKKLSKANIESITFSLFPILADMTERQKKTRAEHRENLLRVYNEKPDLANFDDNAYKFLSAVVDYVAHAEPKRETETAYMNRYISIAEGNPIIDKAYSLVR